MGLGSFKTAWQRQTLLFGHEKGSTYSVLIVDNRGSMHLKSTVSPPGTILVDDDECLVPDSCLTASVAPAYEVLADLCR